MTTAVERLRRGDWRTPLLAGAAGLLAALVVAEFVASSWLLVSEEDVPVARRDWLRLVVGLVGLAFGSPVFFEVSEDEFGAASTSAIVPLTVTIGSLLAFYVLLRRARRDDASALEHALRASVPFALGVALLSWSLGRAAPDEGIELRTGFFEPLVGALVVATATALVAYRDLWKPFPAATRAVLDRWWGAARVAAYGLGTGIALSSLTALLLVFLHADDIGGWGNVLRGLPAFLGFVLNAGIALLSVASGGRGVASAGPTEYVALYRPHGLSPAYWLLLLIPIVTVVLTTRYAARRGGVSWARVAALVAGVWVVLAWASRLRFSLGFSEFGAQAVVGPSLLWGVLALGVWFGLVAPFVAQYAAAGVTATGSADEGMPEPGPRRQDERPPYAMVVALAVVALLGAGAGAVAGDERTGTGIDRELDGP